MPVALLLIPLAAFVTIPVCMSVGGRRWRALGDREPAYRRHRLAQSGGFREAILPGTPASRRLGVPLADRQSDCMRRSILRIRLLARTAIVVLLTAIAIGGAIALYTH